MLKIVYNNKKSEKIEKDIKNAFTYVNKLFKVKSFEITVYVFSNRNDFDFQLKRKTADWMVANASDKGEIHILSPMAMNKESSHKGSEFLQILKHEFTHLFVRELASRKPVPFWLNEGLACFVAKQHQDKRKNFRIQENFCSKLGTSKEWNENIDHNAYPISAKFVNFLIKKYSFSKVEKLIASLNDNYDYLNFKKVFYEVYKIDLNEVEKLSIKEFNK